MMKMGKLKVCYARICSLPRVAAISLLALAGSASASADLETRIGLADPEQGRRQAALCAACHALEKNASPRMGPNLWNVVNRPIASVEGVHYSKALRAREGVWDYAQLDAFLLSPSGYASGTYMMLQGIADENVRAQLIRFLSTLSDNPPSFSNAPQTNAPQGTAAEAASSPAKEVASAAKDPFGADWPQGEGRSLTGYTCGVCHSLAIVKQQGQTRAGWEDLIDWMVEEQGMTALSAQDLETVLQYLSEHFNVQ